MGLSFLPPAPKIWSAAAISMGLLSPTMFLRLWFICTISSATGAAICEIKLAGCSGTRCCWMLGSWCATGWTGAPDEVGRAGVSTWLCTCRAGLLVPADQNENVCGQHWRAARCLLPYACFCVVWWGAGTVEPTPNCIVCMMSKTGEKADHNALSWDDLWSTIEEGEAEYLHKLERHLTKPFEGTRNSQNTRIQRAHTHLVATVAAVTL